MGRRTSAGIDCLVNRLSAGIGMAQRQDRLQVSPEVLSRGEIYLGLQAQQIGLIDEIGSQGDAIAAAARLAKLRHYTVVDLSPENAAITNRTFGSDSATVVEMALAFIRASNKKNIVTTAKHFPGHGDTALDSLIERSLKQNSKVSVNAL